MSTIGSTLDARGKTIYERQELIINQLQKIHDSRYGAQVFKSSKMAFLTAFHGSEALRTGIFPYDPKVDTSMSQTLIKTGVGAIAGPAALALGNALGYTIPKVLHQLPGVGDVLGLVFERVATMGYNKVHEQIAGTLDPSASNIGFLSDSVSRAFGLIYGDSDLLDGSSDSLLQKILKREFGDAWNHALDLVSGRSTDEEREATAIRLVMTRYVMEAVFALASKEESLQALIDHAIDTANPKQLPFETDNLKLEPIVKWHLRKHFGEEQAQQADYNALIVWGERDATITQNDLRESIDKKKKRLDDRELDLTNRINSAAEQVKNRIDRVEKNVDEKIKELDEAQRKTDKKIDNNTLELVEDMGQLESKVKKHQVQLDEIRVDTNTLSEDVTKLMEASAPQAGENTLEGLRAIIDERNQTIETLTQENTQLNNKVTSLENKVDELIALVRDTQAAAAKSQGMSIEAMQRINTLSPTVMAELNNQKKVNEELAEGLAQQQQSVNRNTARIEQLQPDVRQALSRAATARSAATEANRRLNTVTPALHQRMAQQSSTMSQLQQRTERDIGELHAFSLETEERIEQMAQDSRPPQALQTAPEGADTHSLGSASTHSSTPVPETTLGKEEVEAAGFSLEMMANLLESYITSVSVRMPGSFLPSKRLSWGDDGSLIVTAKATLRCPEFKGTLQQFLHQRHKNRADAYRFPTDMKSRLTELGMKRSHYSALVEYAAPFAVASSDQPEASSSGSRQN